MFACAQLLQTGSTLDLRPAMLDLAPAVRQRPMANHEPLLMVLRRGSVRLQSGSEQAPKLFRPGWASLDPPFAHYAREHWSADRCLRYCLIEMPPGACAALLQREVPWARAGQPPWRFNDTRIAWWVEEIACHCAAGEPHGALYTESALMALVAYLLSTLSSARATPAGGVSLNLVRRVRDYVAAHLTSTIGLRDLAALCGCSPGHLNRAFREAVGMPIYRFVIQQRLEHARALLRNDSMPLAEVAMSCGFSNQAHFSTAFRRHVGVTPREFRRIGAGG
jgi:AraC-like DNA-binding protein